MAPTDGRFARLERRWDCRRGTPDEQADYLHKLASLWHFIGPEPALPMS